MTPKLLATDHATASKSAAADASTTVRPADVAREPHRANLKVLREGDHPLRGIAPRLTWEQKG